MAIIVKPCPEDCSFDWVEFHKQLNIALAHLIYEEPSGTYLPSQTSCMTFAEYVYAKSKLKEDPPIAA
jgi:hypothetical protein